MKAIESLRDRINKTYCKCRDFRTDRHIVVMESDDWGSIRMSNKKDWSELLQMGYAVDKRPYERFDTLESATDLEALFETLRKYKDCNGNHPVITANMLMANPDFEKIERSGFKNYYFEPVSKTYERYFGDTKVLQLMSQGMQDGLFLPQSHGREHFNVLQWMHGLRSGDNDLLTAFEHGMCGIAPKDNPERGNQIMNALKADNADEQKAINRIVAEGLNMFEEMWGFKSKTFVAPCYLWNESVERVLAENGVQLIQTARTSKSYGHYKKRFFYSGQWRDSGLLYSIRNCKFEPSTNERETTVDALMAQVESVFSQRKLAVISSHRINYVGGLDEANRSRTIQLLNDFLSAVLKRYPDIEFLSSDKLLDVFN